MATRPERLITYDDYVTFPDEPRVEIIEGEPYVVPAPNRRHQEVLGRLYLRIGTHVERHGGGWVFVAPFDVVLTDFDIVQPDIVFVSDDTDVLNDANIRGTPSFVIEILSPSHPERDRKLKLTAYERTRVPEYWIVDPGAETVTTYRLAGDAYGEPAVHRRGDEVTPIAPAGFVLALADLFA